MSGDPQKDLFVCHSSIDKDWVRKLGSRVEAEQWNSRPLSVFLDEWDVEPGDNILLKIDAALASSRFLAIVLSPEMITSEWCRAEYSALLAQDPTNRKGRLLPMRLRDFHRTTRERLRIPPMLAALNYLDFRDNADFGRQFGRLLAKLKGEPPPRGGRLGAPRRSEAELLVPALPEWRQAPDAEPEHLLSNLLPVTTLPKVVWSAPTQLRTKKDIPRNVHLPPFILREERLYALHSLSRRDGPFAPHIERSGARRHTALDWQFDASRWRWFIELLNLCLREHLRPEILFDRDHKRFWFVPQGNKSVKLRWGAGTHRTVVRAPEPGKAGSWIHHAARLGFETIGSSVFLSVDPTYVFTTDGWVPVSNDLVRPLVMQWGGRERNGTILRHILLWADVVTKGRKVGRVHAGDYEMEIARLPVTVEAPVGLVGDRVRVKALLRFSEREWSLETPFGFVGGDSAREASEEDGEEA